MSKVNVDDVRNTLESRILKEALSYQRATKFKGITYEEEVLPYVLERDYITDFVIEREDGHKIYIEVKGYLRIDDEKKLIAVRRSNPNLDIRIVFDKDNRLTRRKMRYSQWCKKYGFDYSIGFLPKEWLIP